MTLILVLAIVAVIGMSIYASSQAARYLTERDESKRVRAMFSRYVPELVVDDLLERKDPRLFEGREYYATILCCSIWKFSLFAEDLSPQQTLQYLNEFYTLCGQAVQKHRGMIESLHGDGITAVFGVLIDEPFQEERAVRAAMDITRLLSAMNARWQKQGRKPFQVGIGLNSGNIIAGDIGYQSRREFALVGNDVYVATRLQEVTEEMNAAIIASASTFRPVSELFTGIPIKSIPLRGMKKLQEAYIVRGLSKRTADDGLSLPPERSFSNTEIRTPAPPPPPPVPEVQPLRAVPVPKPAPVPASPEPGQATSDNIFEGGPPAVHPSTAPPVAPKELRFSSLDDNEPAMPEPPSQSQTYEDDSGPPLQLGP
ncbi:MAG: adenylate/guanylate cyclase domain-containing protein [Candidatus Eremiobacteraeota bacterium]|nr:adenylate/guanylate cyclase domain-containing protein [Candidatus Eremiobacteraeota bacterium]